MMKYFRTRIICLPILALFWAALATPSLFGQGRSPTVNRVALLGSETGLQLEIRSNIPVATESQVLTGPDRIVIDFLGALPGSALRGFAVHQAGVRAVRVGLFESNPPRTRVVIDLDRPIEYQILPQANAVLVSLGSSSTAATSGPALITVSDRHPVHVAAKVTPPQALPPLQVSYNNGLLWVDARKATLAEVLYQIHLRTGADIPIPAGAEQEKVVMSAGPGPARDVMASLLNGSRFNFVIVGAAQDQKVLRSVILTPKMDNGYDQVMSATQPAVAQPQPQPEAEIPQPEIPQPEPQPDPSAQMQTQPVPEGAPAPNLGQVLPAPTAPPPPPTEEPNRTWTEPPPGTPQPD
jgi:hypothetical protein